MTHQGQPGRHPTMPEPTTRTYDAVEVEAAVMDVMDTIITRSERLGWNDGELSALDVSSRVLAKLDASPAEDHISALTAWSRRNDG